MFLKTESFEHNGVTVTLSELSALQRIEHLALMKRQAEHPQSMPTGTAFTVPIIFMMFCWICTFPG